MGALLLGRAEAETFTREEEESLLTLAEHFAIGIDNLRLYEAVKRSELRVQQIYHHTPVMLHSINRAGNLVEVNVSASALPSNTSDSDGRIVAG